MDFLERLAEACICFAHVPVSWHFKAVKLISALSGFLCASIWWQFQARGKSLPLIRLLPGPFLRSLDESRPQASAGGNPASSKAIFVIDSSNLHLYLFFMFFMSLDDLSNLLPGVLLNPEPVWKKRGTPPENIAANQSIAWSGSLTQSSGMNNWEDTTNGPLPPEGSLRIIELN
jgi:hypothetical protein